MLNRDYSVTPGSEKSGKGGKQALHPSSRHNKRKTIKPTVFSTSFLVAGVIGLILSLMYNVKFMQANSVVMMCIGFYYLVAKRR